MGFLGGMALWNFKMEMSIMGTLCLEWGKVRVNISEKMARRMLESGNMTKCMD